MDKTYYTTEGNKYILKSVTKNINNLTLIANIFCVPTLHVNRPEIEPFIINAPNEASVITPKKIIPLSCTFSAISINIGNLIRADVISPFWFVLLPDLVNNYIGVKALSKFSPVINRSYFTNTAFFAYNTDYNSISVSVTDFINTSPGLIVRFCDNLAGALTGMVNVDFITLNPDSYRTSVTFLYFELE